MIVKRTIPPLISIIIPNYQGKEVFPACMNSLLKQDMQHLQLVFVDDSSTDGSFNLAKKLFGKYKNIIITKTPNNSGFVGACNHGLKFCKGKYIAFINNDATFPTYWAREMYATVKGKKKVVAATMVLQEDLPVQLHKLFKQGLFPVGSVTYSGCYRRLHPLERKYGRIELSVNGILMIPRSALGKFIFTPGYFAYGEDIDLCYRLWLRGYRIVGNMQAIMYHYGSYTKKKVPSFSKKAAFHGTKNMITNFLIFYETKNVLKLAPAFFFLQFASLIAKPNVIPSRMKSYFWVLLHMGDILKRRKEIQRTRVLSDEKFFGILSYKLHEERMAAGRWRAVLVHLANVVMRWYCKIVRIKTFDIDDANALPTIDVSAITPFAIKESGKIKASGKNRHVVISQDAAKDI